MGSVQYTESMPLSMLKCTVGHKSHDPCLREKYMEAGVMTFVAHCTKVSCRMSCCLMLAEKCHCNGQFSKTTTPSTLLDALSRFFKTWASMFLSGRRAITLMRPLSRICGRLPTKKLTDRKPRVWAIYGSRSKKPGTQSPLRNV